MQNRVTLGLLLMSLLGGGAIGEEQSPESESAESIPLEPVKCVQILRIRNTDIIDDRTIVFYMRGKDIYLNRLPNRCAGLKVADAFGYETSLNVLCNVDVIKVLRNFGGGFQPGPACGLGMFEPTSREEIALLKERPLEPDAEAGMPQIEESLEDSEQDPRNDPQDNPQDNSGDNPE